MSQLYEKSLGCVFFLFFFPILSEISLLIWMKFSMLPQPVGLLKLSLDLFCRSNILRRELCRRYFVRYQNICEPICFKLGMMLITMLTLEFDFSLDDLDVHSRSQGYTKARTCAVIVL